MDLVTFARRAVRDGIFNPLQASAFVSMPMRRRILHAAGFDLAKNVRIMDGCTFTGPVAIGPGSFVNRCCYFEAKGGVIIGARCSIGFNVAFCTSTHEIGEERRAGDWYARPIVVGDLTWIGARVLILPGATIGEGCVIAAGSVVRNDCEPHAMYAGVPARRIRGLDQ